MNISEQRDLLSEAIRARAHAYAPYSRFQVGAALLTQDATVIHGCNVENAAYSLCHCAERTALGTAIARGYRRKDMKALAVVADTKQLISPCGACRQVLFELGGADFTILMGNLNGEFIVTTAGELLPYAFSSSHLIEDEE